MSAVKKLLNHSWQGIQKLRPSAQGKLRPSAQGVRKNFQPSLLALEERWVPSTTSSITASFNGAAIPAGETLWLDAETKVGGLPKTGTVNLYVTNQTVTFSAGGTTYTESVPDSTITLSSSTTTATAAFDDGSNQWDINLPLNFGGNAFMSGGAVAVPVNLPGGIKNVTWTGNFATDTAKVTMNWQWGAAAYSQFGSDYNLDNVKPVDGPGPVTIYNNGDHAGTPEAFKPFVLNGGTGGGGNNWTGNLSPGKAVTPSVNSGGATLYPFASSNPLTSIAFNESDVLAAAKLDTTNGTFDLWYTDEHALSLGVRQVNVVSSTGTQTTNYAVAPLTTNPGSAINPAIGTTAASGDQAGTDTSGRPIAPELYITDITNNPNSLAGDWQYGGTGYAPNAVFGAWKGAVRTVTYSGSTPNVTVTCDADPAKNLWNLGTGSDAPPPGLANEGYGAEVRWDLNAMYNSGILQAGHTYRFYVMCHDGDQNKSGGDAGQAAFNYYYPGPPVSATTSLAGYVFADNNGTGIFGQGNSGLPTMTVTLSGTYSKGNQVFLQTMTDATGYYSFTGLNASDANGYTLSVTPSGSYSNGLATVGTVNGNNDGMTPSFGMVSSILLNSGDQGTNYNFAEEIAS